MDEWYEVKTLLEELLNNDCLNESEHRILEVVHNLMLTYDKMEEIEMMTAECESSLHECHLILLSR